MTRLADGTFMVGKPPAPCECVYCTRVRREVVPGPIRHLNPPTEPRMPQMVAQRAAQLANERETEDRSAPEAKP
jgi:hypothetical protein